MVPFEAFLAEKPVITTADAGGPLEVVTDRRTGLVCEPRPAAVAEACAWLRDHVDDARMGAGRPSGRGAADLGSRHRSPPRMKVAYYSPLSPSRSGVADYSALLLPALGQRIDVEIASPGRLRRSRRPTSPSTT